MPRPEPELPAPADAPNPAAQHDILLPDDLADALRAARSRTGRPDWRATIGQHDEPGTVFVWDEPDHVIVCRDVPEAVAHLEKQGSKQKKA